MLERDKSSDDEAFEVWRRLIAYSEVSHDEFLPFNSENWYGTIGDRITGKEDISNSSF